MKKIISTLFLVLSFSIFSQNRYELVDEGNDKLFLSDSISKMAIKSLITDKPIVVIDGKPFRYQDLENQKLLLSKTEIEKITNRVYSDSTIFLINYNYLDDNCSDWFLNKLSSEIINDRKTFIEPLKKGIEYKSNVIYLALFENGIVLKNKPNQKRNIFFLTKIIFLGAIYF